MLFFPVWRYTATPTTEYGFLWIVDMTEAPYQFDFSEENIKKTNRDMLFLFFPVFIVCVIGFGFFITGFKIKETLICSGSALLTMFVVWAVEIPLLNRRQRKIRVFVHNDKIVKQCGKHENDISWENVSLLKIKEDNKGIITHIKIRGKDKTLLWLYGLNEMGKLASLIKERISVDALVNTRRNKLDLRITGIIAAIATFIFMTIIASFGAKAMDIFAILASFGVSCFLLLYRPLRKSDRGLKWIEIGVSLLMLLLGIYGLISFLKIGYVP